MDLASSFIALGALFSVGLAADWIGRRTRLPRVTLLLACGLIAGEPGLGLIPDALRDWYEFLSITALTMVALLLGGSLSRRALAAHGQIILLISFTIVVVTLVLVSAGLYVGGMAAGPALIFGAIATATAPAATLDVIRQSGSEGRFAEILKGIVAIDDLWGLIAFAFVLVAVQHISGTSSGHALTEASYEIFGSIGLGILIGAPAAYLTGRISDGEPLEIEALGLVFLIAGLCLALGLSFLIAGIATGAMIVNLARHHTRAFHEIEHLEWPFMVLFFLLAGASLEPAALIEVGGFGLLYIVLRTAARFAGGWIGGVVSRVPAPERPLYGPALLPQAGVAVGMALLAGEAFPDWADMLMALTVGSTVAFELLGPAATLWALERARRLEERHDIT